MDGIHDDEIVRCNIVLSSLVPVLLYLCVARLGVDRRAALVGAFITAAHPWAILFSGVLNRQATYQFAAFASVLALIVYIDNRNLRFAFAAMVATVLAILSRPEGADVLVVDIAVILFSRMPAGRKILLAAAARCLRPSGESIHAGLRDRDEVVPLAAGARLATSSWISPSSRRTTRPWRGF